MRIETLTHHGMGRAADGSLHARVLPGEDIDPNGRILIPSENRVSAPCRHYNGCGGCTILHARDDFVADWKRGIVTQALAAHGLPAPIRAMHTSPARSRRRAKLSGRRTKKGALVGFHARASGTIVGVPECQLLRPEIAALIPALEELVTQAASRKSELDLTITQSEAGADVMVAGVPEAGALDMAELAAWAEHHDIARLTIEDDVIVTRRTPFHHFGPARITPPPGAFLQATQDSERALASSVMDALDGCKQVVDLFAGCGTFTLPMARNAVVHAVEGDGAMLAALGDGWRMAQGVKQVTTQTCDLFRNPLIGDDLARFDGAIIDPPRAGAQAQIAQICAGGPNRVAYVSCNPVTFARDAARMAQAGYLLQWIDVVDQFRWSHHVEIAASFHKG